jgi:hypothetical protein
MDLLPWIDSAFSAVLALLLPVAGLKVKALKTLPLLKGGGWIGCF